MFRLACLLIGFGTAACTTTARQVKHEEEAQISQTTLPAPGADASSPPARYAAADEGQAVQRLSVNHSSTLDPDTASQNQPAADPARKVIYTADLDLRVTALKTTLEAIEAIVAAKGGVIYNETLGNISFGVRPEHFKGVVAELEQLGEVTRRNIASEDVTAKFFDLQLRIEVAETSRARLLELIKNRGEVKDILEVEKDIRRLTEEIEQLKGAARVMQERISLSRISVSLMEKKVAPIATPPPPPRRSAAALFPWMDEIGADRIMRDLPTERPMNGGGKLLLVFPRADFRLDVPQGRVAPESFLPVLHSESELIAATPEDSRLRVRRIKSEEQKGTLEFWTQAMLYELREYRGYIVEDAKDFEMRDGGLKAKVLRAKTEHAGQGWAYELWIIMDPSDEKNVFVAEFARPNGGADKHLKEVEEALAGMKSRI